MDEDPYEVLHLSRECTDKELNQAYFYVCKLYHPDKGGSEKEFLRLQAAYKTIKRWRKTKSDPSLVRKPKTHFELKLNHEEEDEPLVVQDDDVDTYYAGSDRTRFLADKFNERFSKRNDRQWINETAPRNKSTYLDERSRALTQSKTRPLFSGRFAYDQNTFNHVFNHMQVKHGEETGEVEEVFEEPSHRPAQTNVECVEYDLAHQMMDFKTKGVYQNPDYRGYLPPNPKSVSQRVMSRMKQRENITRVPSMSKQEVEQRLSTRQDPAALHRRPPISRKHRQMRLSDII